MIRAAGLLDVQNAQCRFAKVTGAYLLADETKKPLKVTENGTGLDVSLPEQPLDPIATVLVLETV